MSGKIYLVGDSGDLMVMDEAPYKAEELLQKLLADYPDLLAGDQMRPSAPRRWLLVSRELSVPDDESEKGRWSLDHLFIDQEGIPTLVEVKRSSNTQIRREVVGQMLDYAANGTVYWSLEQILAAFERRCDRDGLDPDQAVRTFLGDESEWESSDFWQATKTNLQAGRIRLVFVADRIPPELRRIIEFLNEQMDPAEVLGGGGVPVRGRESTGSRSPRSWCDCGSGTAQDRWHCRRASLGPRDVSRRDGQPEKPQ